MNLIPKKNTNVQVIWASLDPLKINTLNKIGSAISSHSSRNYAAGTCRADS